MGTAGYMSPEQVRGEPLDARTDLFSFGLILYEMATGQRAFSGDTAAILKDAILNHIPTPVHDLNSTLPPKLEQIVNKAIEKDREKRYQSAAEMRADLETVSPDRQPIATKPLTRRRWKLLAIAAVVVAVMVGRGLYWRLRNAVKLTDKDTIILTDFANNTTDPVFDEALTFALRTELEQSPFLQLLSNSKVKATLKTMDRPLETRLTPEVAREVCLRTNSKALLTGSIADAGNHYVLNLRAVECQGGKTLASTRAEAENRKAVVHALGQLGSQMREELGESRGSVLKFNQPLEEATSSSLEALQAFAHHRVVRGSTEALPDMKRAVEYDPNFAIAYKELGAYYSNLGQETLATRNYTRAYELRDRTTERDRGNIEGIYYLGVTGENEKAIQAYSKMTQSYPMDVESHHQLGLTLADLGRYDEAAREEDEAVRLAITATMPVVGLIQD